MLVEKPQPKPKLTDDELHTLRRFLRTVILRATWSDEADHRRSLAKSVYDCWAMMARDESEHLWSIERKLHIEGLPAAHAIMVLLNTVQLHLFDPSARRAA